MRSFKRPNVLIIYTDQQRQDSLGCYGNKLAKTPNLDKLASEGVRFDNYYVQNPVCMPSRMAFLSGRYCGSLGIGTNGIPFPDDAIAINQLLKPYGYETAQIGKLHFQPHAARDHRDPHPDYGFDTFILSDEPGCYDDAYIKWVECVAPHMVDKVRVSLPPAAYNHNQIAYSKRPRSTEYPYIFEGDEDVTQGAFVASEMCSFIERERDKPFFAIAGFYAPHSPVNPPKRFVDMYNPKDMPLPKLGEDEKYAKGLENISAEKWQEVVAYYLALVSHIDDCVGRILKSLKKVGQEENTIVIFTSDHGEFLGDHGRVGKGMPGHDCIIRVPFIIKYPEKLTAGGVIDELAEAVDVVPTLLDYCGIQIPRIVQGKTLRPLLEGKQKSHREDILVESFVPFGKKQVTIRTKEYKYYCSSDGQEILYDMVNDPNELRNIVNDAQYKNVLSDMRKRMIIRLQTSAFNGREKTAEY